MFPNKFRESLLLSSPVDHLLYPSLNREQLDGSPCAPGSLPTPLVFTHLDIHQEMGLNVLPTASDILASRIFTRQEKSKALVWKGSQRWPTSF